MGSRAVAGHPDASASAGPPRSGTGRSCPERRPARGGRGRIRRAVVRFRGRPGRAGRRRVPPYHLWEGLPGGPGRRGPPLPLRRQDRNDRRMGPMAAETPQPSAPRARILVASLAGSTIEWFDFFLYGTAAALVFDELFFPSEDPLVSLMLSYLTFSLTFFIRPFGGGASPPSAPGSAASAPRGARRRRWGARPGRES